MNRLWQSIIADFKQRTRQQSYMITLLLMAALTLLFFPSPESEYQTLVINGYRGIYNSAWVGICLALLNMLLLPLICFYLLKSAIEVDRRSQTGELIAATPISKQTYLFAKWSVSVFILISIICVMVVGSIAIQLYYGESYEIDLWLLIWPQLIFVLPMLFVIASIALMFETVKWLRGGWGNLIYFFLWNGSTVYIIESAGIGSIMRALDKEVEERFPVIDGKTNVGITLADDNNPIKTFVWQGIEPTMGDVWAVLPFLIISLCCLIVAYFCFDRFSINQTKKSEQISWISTNVTSKVSHLLDSVMSSLTNSFMFTQLAYLELKLLLKNRSMFWFMGLIGGNIAQLTVEKPLLVAVILPISWLWCSLVISQLGQFEKQSRTQELISYSQKSLFSQGLTCYFAAWSLLMLAGLGSIIRFASSAEWLLIVQLIIAVSFTVSLAYFCGALSGTKRLFEGVYPILWYMGPIQGALYLDFFGSNSQISWSAGVPYVFSLTAVVVLGLALTLRKRSHLFQKLI